MTGVSNPQGSKQLDPGSLLDLFRLQHVFCSERRQAAETKGKHEKISSKNWVWYMEMVDLTTKKWYCGSKLGNLSLSLHKYDIYIYIYVYI
jgi:hypothetical protein